MALHADSLAEPSPRHRVGRRALLAAVQLGLVIVYLVSVARFYRPGVGFTPLILFTATNHDSEIPAVRDTPHYDDPASGGYDGQYYAQLAMTPLLTDGAVDRGVDSAPYRARRILFSWTAYVFGLGRPYWILQAYALQNVACWLIFAWWLSRRLAPADARTLLVWFACLFGHGMLESTRRALVDGPSLLLIALGVTALERGRGWLGSAVLGVSGLARETNLLAGVALLDAGKMSGRRVARLCALAIVLLLPTLLWLDYLRSIYRSEVLAGAGDYLVLPFTALFRTWRVTLSEIARGGWASPARFSLMVLVGLMVQAVYLLIRARPRELWWRVGAAYVLLMLTMAAGVWEGHPGAATRVLLPMTVAFNLLLPEGSWFWPLFILGNLGVVPGLAELEVPLVSKWL